MSLISTLRSSLGTDAVLVSPQETAGFTEDWRGRFRGRAACVVLPSSTEQVALAVRAAVQAGVPVLPQGGNTSLCGGAVPDPDRAPVVLNLGRMRRVRAIDAANHSIEVEAGCVLAQVQQAAMSQGRLYPVSLGAEGSCQIGGNIATNAGGTGVLRYGNTRENVLGLEVVLPDGRIWDGLYRLRKNNTGLDLKHLFIGSEGTLGVITAAVLKLHPLPAAHAAAWVALRDPASALALLGRFQARCGATLSAFELINALQLQLVLDNVPGRRAPLDATQPWHLLVELADNGDEASLAASLESVLEAAGADGIVQDAAIAVSGAQRAAFWEIRHSVSEANKKAGVGLTTDCAVPVSAVPAFIAQATAATHALLPALPVVVVAHLGDGNVHFIPFLAFDQWQALPDRDAVARRLKRAIDEVAVGMGGTFSAEHGIGQVLTQEMGFFKPDVELDLMRGIKALVDPRDLFNPGRLLPAATTTPKSS